VVTLALSDAGVLRVRVDHPDDQHTTRLTIGIDATSTRPAQAEQP
jgi:hypothetical protein